MGCDEPGTLMGAAQKLLASDKRSTLDIHKATGLPYHWLNKFGQGQMENPSVNRVQFLYEILSGKKLNLR